VLGDERRKPRQSLGVGELRASRDAALALRSPPRFGDDFRVLIFVSGQIQASGPARVRKFAPSRDSHAA
jgi:hypothetical protein